MQIVRNYKLYQAAASDLLGDAVFFYGDQCMHWISPVVSGRRTILQMASWHWLYRLPPPFFNTCFSMQRGNLKQAAARPTWHKTYPANRLPPAMSIDGIWISAAHSHDILGIEPRMASLSSRQLWRLQLRLLTWEMPWCQILQRLTQMAKANVPSIAPFEIADIKVCVCLSD